MNEEHMKKLKAVHHAIEGVEKGSEKCDARR